MKCNKNIFFKPDLDQVLNSYLKCCSKDFQLSVRKHVTFVVNQREHR